MYLKDVLPAIAKEVAGVKTGPQNGFRKDCHGKTAKYFREEGGKDTDRIIMYGKGTQVYHSIVVDRDSNIVSDLFSNGEYGQNGIKDFDKETLVLSYTVHPQTHKGLEAIADVPFSEFKQKYLNNKVSFKNFVNTSSKVA